MAIEVVTRDNVNSVTIHVNSNDKLEVIDSVHNHCYPSIKG